MSSHHHASSSSSSSANASAAAAPVSDADSIIVTDDMIQAFLNKLFDQQEQRAAHVEASRKLLQEMTATKTWLQKWMARNNLAEVGVGSRHRHLKRKTRKVYDSVTMPKLLDKIEERYGEAERRYFDLWIEQTKKTVLRQVTDYKITYDGVRQQGQRNSGAMPARKRAAAGGVAGGAVASSGSSSTGTTTVRALEMSDDDQDDDDADHDQ